MILFLILSIPLLSLIYMRVFSPESLTSIETLRVFLRGLVSFLISVLPLYLIIRLYPVRFNETALYIRTLILDFLVVLVPLLLFFLFWEKKKIEYEYGQRLFVHIFSFVSGFSVLLGGFYAFVYYSFYTGYRAFGFPLLFTLVLVSVVISFYMYVTTMDWKRHLILGIPFMTALLCSVAALLIELSYTALGIILCLLYLSIGGFLLYILYKNRFIPLK